MQYPSMIPIPVYILYLQYQLLHYIYSTSSIILLNFFFQDGIASGPRVQYKLVYEHKEADPGDGACFCYPGQLILVLSKLKMQKKGRT